MIREYLKERFMIVVLPNGKQLKPVTRTTDRGCSNYANERLAYYYQKYGNEFGNQVKVLEYKMTKDLKETVLVNEWSA